MSAVPLECEPQDAYAETGAHATAATLKLQAAERLAAHRARRGRPATPQLPGLELTPNPHPDTRAARIAAAVAERYAHSQSYRAFLAAEAERAIQQAEAAAEIATRTAQAVVATQQQLLSELADWNPAPSPGPEPVASPISQQAAALKPDPPATLPPPARLTVRLYEEVDRSPSEGVPNAVPYEALNDEERFALDEEIAFRQSPIFEEFLEPASPLPANLIEFPRQLVAPRKARPRLAEGPLREESEVAPESAQLRIFEVEPGQISTEVVLEPESVLPEWSSIRLDAIRLDDSPAAATVKLREDLIDYSPTLLAAPLSLRLMSALVDGCLILTAFLGFVTVFACTAGRLPTGHGAALGAVATLAALTIAYQLLFFTFSNATPGMRYARIGLCTFSDDNPTRSAMRRRIIAILLASCPLGLGLLWAWLDEDHLGWHDRISGMYQRSY